MTVCRGCFLTRPISSFAYNRRFGAQGRLDYHATVRHEAGGCALYIERAAAEGSEQ